ncbi:c-type cytochrome [Sphingomonas bacterium]|uniref:c-type cytochrome n=1 Tax=Sphingomonas bacterium TaxID=1895847 RepID=UPI001575CBDA|nr:cytochrome C [Sphingomonas bacterium]
MRNVVLGLLGTISIGAASVGIAQMWSGKIADQVQARSDYIENCGGCHGINGDSAPALLPVLRDRVGYFLCDREARAYLIQLPNVAHSRISDNAELADLLNYVVFTLGGPSTAASSPPFTAAEVSRERPHALSEVSLKAIRARLVERVIKNCKAPASLRLLFPVRPDGAHN